MSFDALAWAWNQKTGSAGRKATLMGVAQFADEDGYCWPGQKMLAEYTEQSARTIREHLTWLEENDFLSRKLVRKASTAEIRLPVIRMEASQKCAKGVHVQDLADYLDARREAAKKELEQLVGR